jgi:predicted permease
MTDLRYALRSVRSSPGFATVVIMTLAIGIGANTATVSVLDTVLRRELPVQAPEELVFVRTAGARGLGSAPPYPYFDRIRRESSSFAGMAAFAADELRIGVGGSVEQVFGQVSSGNYFEVLGVEPVAGRLMSAGDEKLSPPVAVIGYGYWQRRFGGSSDAIGQTLSFRDRTFTIIGVTPSPFLGLDPGRQVDVTLPITIEPDMVANRQAQWFNVVARVRTGVDARQATAQINARLPPLRAELSRLGQDTRAPFDRIELTPASRGLDRLRARFTGPLSAMTLVTVILLLITCANLGGLLLVRGAMRTREIALRLATGASSGRLLRQLLTETLVLFVLGAAAGLFVAYAGIEALTGFFATGRRPILLAVQFDWRIVAYALGVTLVASVASGLWPALRALRIEPHTAIKERAPGWQKLGARRVLLAGQVALSLVLLVAATLFARTMMNIRATDLGFTPGGVVTVSVDPALARDAGADAREQLWTQWLERIRGLPGVRSASLSVLTPLSGRNTGVGIAVPGTTVRTEIRLNHVSSDYFSTFGIELLAGRPFTQQDRAGSLKVVMLSASAAQRLFAGRSPVGERVEFGRAGVYQVVGVVRDHKHLSVREQAQPVAFVPLSQPVDPIAGLTLAVSSGMSGTAIVRTVAGEIRKVRPATLVSDVMTVNGQIDETLVSERLLSSLATGFAALVLALAVVGLYGMVSYTVATRTTEFGIRLALGAPRSNVAAGVIAQAMLPVAAGIATGLPVALMIARATERLLFGVTSADPTSYLFAAGAMILVAGGAAALPVRRACALDPAETLRRG